MFKTMLFLLLSLSASFVAAQDYRNYSEISSNIIDGEYLPGTYYVLVSAEWCSPCQRLKRDLKQYPKQIIYYVDFDTNQKTARKIMGSRTSLPTFIRYEVGETSKKTIFNFEPVNQFIIEEKFSKSFIEGLIKDLEALKDGKIRDFKPIRLKLKSLLDNLDATTK